MKKTNFASFISFPINRVWYDHITMCRSVYFSFTGCSLRIFLKSKLTFRNNFIIHFTSVESVGRVVSEGLDCLHVEESSTEISAPEHN